MKNAREYHSFYLSIKERELIDKVVAYIADNHKDDEWWKIDRSIRNYVGLSLGTRLANEAFDEEMLEDAKREEEEKIKKATESAKEQAEEAMQKSEADEIFYQFIMNKED